MISRPGRLTALLPGAALMALLLVGSCAAAAESQRRDLLRPAPHWSADQVIQVVLRALAQPDEPYEGAGIEQTWVFASPANRRQTGPLERFRELVGDPAYKPLLGHRRARRDELMIQDDTAYQEVEIIGAEGTRVVYVFQLRRHTTEDCADCWMTDAVVPIEREDPEAI